MSVSSASSYYRIWGTHGFLGCWQDKHRRVGDGALVVTVVDDKIEKVVTIVFGGFESLHLGHRRLLSHVSGVTTVGADLRTFAKGSLRLQ